MILAGGLGTRLRPYTHFLPKPMLGVGAKPILEHIVDWLRANDVKDIVIATGYLGRVIERYFGDGREFGVRIEYARSDRPLGHAGQLKSAEKLLPQTFVCLYGDAILEFDLKKLIHYHERKASLLTMALMEYETKMKYGVIEAGEDGRISRWKEKPVVTSDINVGCYVMDRGFLGYIPPRRIYGVLEAFKSAFADGKAMYALKVSGNFTDIGDIEALEKADEEFIGRYGKIP